jgi:hypothetical protein
MPTCNNCGGEIIFRNIDGMIRPVHLSGGCWGDSSPSVWVAKERTYAHHEDFCRRTTCPICRCEVFFIRHNGGSVWVDELGWPWPKHACFDDSWASQSLRTIAEAVRWRASKPYLGLVIRTRSLSPDLTALIVRRSDGHFVRVLVENGSVKLAGELVAVLHEHEYLRSSLRGHESLKILKLSSATESTTLEDHWQPGTGRAINAGAAKQPHCPYCKREIPHEKLIAHLCSEHGPLCQ